MTEVQTPLPTGASSAAQPSTVDKDSLITRLDTLLEQYLHTLDSYEKLTQQLSKQLSSGYFSLTQANFHNRSGVHYGRDRYDERVQATRKIVVSEDEECRLRFETSSTLNRACGTGKDGHSSDAPATGEEQSEEKTEEDTSTDQNPDATNASADDAKDAEEKSDAAKPATVDPIRMFGILVPPALRSAQTLFSEAVDGPVVKLVEVAGELRALEREIGRVRKGIRKA